MNRLLWRFAVPAAVLVVLTGGAAQAQSPTPAPDAPTSAQATSSDGIAAVVGNEVITRYDLDQRVRELQQQLVARNAGKVPAAAALRPHVLQEMIDEYALAEYASETGLEVSDAALQRALQGIAAGNHLSVDQLRSQVQRQGMNWQDFSAQIRREVLIARLRERDVASKVKVGEQEIDDYLARQRLHDRDDASARLHLAQIFVPLPEHPSAQQLRNARVVIDDAAAALRQGRRFSMVANEFSMGPQATKGGDLGTREASQWPSLFVRAVRDLQPGQVSAVIRSPAGFHILELLGRQQASALPRTAMQAEVREIVIDADTDASRKAAVRELRGVRRAVLAGEVGFAAKAREISQDLRTARSGGELGWLLPGQLPAALDAALQALNPGEVSQPLLLPGKVVLLQLVDRREHALAPGQERAVVRSLLLRQKEAKAFDELLQDVRARTYVRLPDDDS